MIGSYLYSFGQYCSSFVYTWPSAAEQRASLQQTLLQHVADNEHEATRTLLIDNRAEEWTDDDDMALAFSLLRSAIEHHSVQTFDVLVDKLPLDALKMRTDDTEQTLPMLTVHAEQTEMLNRYFSTLFDRLTNHYIRSLPLQLMHRRVTSDLDAIVDAQDRDGNTALMHAAHGGHEPSVARLCLARASTLPQNAAGHRVLDLVAHLPDDDPLAHRVRNRHIGEIQRMRNQA